MQFGYKRQGGFKGSFTPNNIGHKHRNLPNYSLFDGLIKNYGLNNSFFEISNMESSSKYSRNRHLSFYNGSTIFPMATTVKKQKIKLKNKEIEAIYNPIKLNVPVNNIL